ncbi:hypothetical protein [Lewinella sp. IMCC34191]|uniref:hypothetical protein n=1 Tax=Lewinella sp. IMCC34191 TaxID=2259172 RepID=UPI0013002FE7|nr:hypothetical protein [Lewinella sp. IMCC34191]
MNSGRFSSRGYLIQAVVALLDSFNHSWETVEIEPDSINDKVDIAWYSTEGDVICQVKSSINNFQDSKIIQIIADLIEAHPEAKEYRVSLVGNGSDSVLNKFRNINSLNVLDPSLNKYKNKIKVNIHPLDLDILYEAIFSKVHKFLSSHDYILSYDTVKLISEGIVLKFVTMSGTKEIMSRQEFENKLLDWVEFFYSGSKHSRSLKIGNTFQNADDQFPEFSKIHLLNKNTMFEEIKLKIAELARSVEAMDVTANEVFDTWSRAVASGKIYEQTKYGRLTKDNYYKADSFVRNDNEVRQIIEELSNVNIDRLLNFGNLMFRFPSIQSGPETIGTKSEKTKFSQFTNLLKLVNQYLCYNKFLEPYEDFRVVSLFLENNTNITHENIEVQIAIQGVKEVSTLKGVIEFKNTQDFQFLIENRFDFMNSFRYAEPLNFSEYDNYGIFPLHANDVSSMIYRDNKGHMAYDLEYLNRFVSNILAFDNVALKEDLLTLNVSFKKIRAGEKMLFPSYIFIKPLSAIAISAQVLSDQLDRKIEIKCT